MYLLDSSAIIDPFRRAKLEAIHAAVSGGGRASLNLSGVAQTEQYLERWFEEGFAMGRLVVCEEVYEEVVGKTRAISRDRDLLERLNRRGKLKMLQPIQDTYGVLERIAMFVRSNYESHQAQGFLEGYDPMLIALAKSYGAVLVTEERNYIPERDVGTGLVKGKPCLPFVAWAFEVECVGLLQVLLKQL